MKFLTLFTLFFLMMTSQSMAGLGSYGYSSPYSSDVVTAPIRIKSKGMFNLVVSIQFQRVPFEKKDYESDEYKNFIERLKVEWGGVALQQILSEKEIAMSELVKLKNKIEAGVQKHADGLKAKYSLKSKTEVVFSLSNFFFVKID